MARVRDLLARKGPDVVHVSSAASVLDAAQLMNQHRIGGVVVIDDGRLVGIFTERDVLSRVVARQLDPAATPVRDVMTSSLLTIPVDASVDECRALMTERRVRHVPVLGPAGIEGLVTSGDVMAWEVSENETTIRQLQDYVHYSR